MALDRPKPLLDVGGISMVRRAVERLRPFVARVVIATDRPDLYADLGALAVSDAVPGYAGPLAGLQAGAQHILGGDTSFAGLVSAAGDTPFLPADLVPRLTEGAGPSDLRVAAFEDRLHPVCAYWPADALERVAALSLRAERAPSLQSVMREHGFVAVAFPPSTEAPGGDPFFNVNTPGDLEAARRAVHSGG